MARASGSVRRRRRGHLITAVRVYIPLHLHLGKRAAFWSRFFEEIQ
jgi:hypothetical protein